MSNTTINTNPLFISRKNFAKRLGVPYQSMQDWDSSGKIPKPIKIGGSILYRVIDVDAFIAKYFTDEELKRA